MYTDSQFWLVNLHIIKGIYTPVQRFGVGKIFLKSINVTKAAFIFSKIHLKQLYCKNIITV